MNENVYIEIGKLLVKGDVSSLFKLKLLKLELYFKIFPLLPTSWPGWDANRRPVFYAVMATSDHKCCMYLITHWSLPPGV